MVKGRSSKWACSTHGKLFSPNTGKKERKRKVERKKPIGRPRLRGSMILKQNLKYVGSKWTVCFGLEIGLSWVLLYPRK
jgi:hypothetical protein